jgi:hypothetical protein
MKLKLILILTAVFYTAHSTAQIKLDSAVTMSFYVDAYYSYDFNEPYDHERPEFLYQYGKHNQFSINMAMANLNYKKGDLEANLGLNTGDFVSRNMAHEDQLLRMLYQANVSYTFLDKFTFMMGMFSSHMGYESALSFDNLLTSHSLPSEWTPYYQAGARLTYEVNEKWLISATLANGIQNITETPGNSNKSIGGQVAWSPTENITLNYSNLYVNDLPDDSALFVFYNNCYATFTFFDKLDLVAGYDFAFGNNNLTSQQTQFSIATLLARYRLTDKWALSGRAEFYDDPDNTWISTNAGRPFVVNSYSGNVDFSPIPRLKFRLESRFFDSEYPIFKDEVGVNPNTANQVTYVPGNLNVLLAVQFKM